MRECKALRNIKIYIGLHGASAAKLHELAEAQTAFDAAMVAAGKSVRPKRQ
jgi:hypothetical protein